MTDLSFPAPPNCTTSKRGFISANRRRCRTNGANHPATFQPKGHWQRLLGMGTPLYTRCLSELGLSRDEVLAIEDSEGGTAAVVESGLPVMVTYNEITQNGRFPSACLIAPTLASFILEQISFLCLGAES